MLNEHPNRKHRIAQAPEETRAATYRELAWLPSCNQHYTRYTKGMNVARARGSARTRGRVWCALLYWCRPLRANGIDRGRTFCIDSLASFLVACCLPSLAIALALGTLYLGHDHAAASYTTRWWVLPRRSGIGSSSLPRGIGCACRGTSRTEYVSLAGLRVISAPY